MNGSKNNPKNDTRNILPQRFLAKLQRISNQIDFITKYAYLYTEQHKY